MYITNYIEPTVSKRATCAVVCTYGCDEGRIAPTRCAISDAGLDGGCREHGDAGSYAAVGISSTSRSIPGYQRLKMALSSPFSIRTRVCNNNCALSLDHCIWCFL